MALEVKYQNDVEGFGDRKNSLSVSMCYFSMIKTDNAKYKYLKSTGFASCVGLILYSATDTLLAHFQSANWVNTGAESSVAAFGMHGINDFQQYEGFLFLGSHKATVEKPKARRISGELKSSHLMYDPSVLINSDVLKSNKSSQEGRDLIHDVLFKRGVKFHQQTPTTGYTSVAVDPLTGEVRLFHEAPLAPISFNYTRVTDGAALQFTDPI
jgi:hypothetical protein